MRACRAVRLLVLLCIALAVFVLHSVSAFATLASPAWRISSVPAPTNFIPGDESGRNIYEVWITNAGGKVTNGSPFTITDTLPAGVTAKSIELPIFVPSVGNVVDESAKLCETKTEGEVQTVRCAVAEELLGTELEPVQPGEALRLVLHVANPPAVMGTLANFVRVQGAGAPAASGTFTNQVSSKPAPGELYEYHTELTASDGSPSIGAGSHPYQFTTSFAADTTLGLGGTLMAAGGDLKDIHVTLPPGFVGNPTASSKCTAQQLNTVAPGQDPKHIHNSCPDSSAVGVVVILQLEGKGTTVAVPVYNMVPPPGMPAQLGFTIFGAPVYIDTELRSGSDYGVTGVLRNSSEAKRVTAARVTLWGVPADTSHDEVRGQCLGFGLAFSVGSCPAGRVSVPFLRLPTSCESPLGIQMSFNTWSNPDTFLQRTSVEPVPGGCSELNFEPGISVVPQSTIADSPTGLSVTLHLPQSEAPYSPAEADLRNAVVTLPEGMSVNPASAAGLAGCTPAQVGLISLPGKAPAVFNAKPAECPGASKVGSVEIKTPLLDHPVKGSVYVASQGANPFGSLLAIYITAYDSATGVVLKLGGDVELDPKTGRLTTVFTNNPQLPFEDLDVSLLQGPRAPLRTPVACGSYVAEADFSPWSAPASGPDARPSSSFAISHGPAGPCPTRKLEPKLSAGVTTPIAGTYSPFALRLSRNDGSGEFAAVNVETPRGITAKLKGVAYCPESDIKKALDLDKPGDGAVELGSPSCPAASQVGTSIAGAGAGPYPLYTSGSVYLAGPYKGAPLSLIDIVPAVAGPFDFGVVVDRVALRVDPETAQVTAESDPFPTILSGIPLDIRDIRLDVNREGFTRNPTDCSPMNVNAKVFGLDATSASASDHFQVGGCRGLPFSPSLSLRLRGGIRRGDHPALRAELHGKEGEADIAHVSVALPHSEFLAQEHIRTICTRTQFAANSCPSGSVYGWARAFSPLLEAPLEGPVYLRSSSNPLPDLVIALSGQISIDLVGRIDSVDGGIRTTFAMVPDAPVSKFVLSMQGGRKGLLVNSRNICASPGDAYVELDGQNGLFRNLRLALKAHCSRKSKR
jgi:hypothetical protein